MLTIHWISGFVSQLILDISMYLVVSSYLASQTNYVSFVFQRAGFCFKLKYFPPPLPSISGWVSAKFLWENITVDVYINKMGANIEKISIQSSSFEYGEVKTTNGRA